MGKIGGIVVCGLALAVGMTGCLNNETIVPTTQAGVALFHSSPDAPSANILVDNVVINTDAFKYKNHSNYVDFEAGDRRVKFNGYTNGASLVDTTLNFETKKFYSLFLITLPSTKKQVIKVQDVGDIPPSGKAMVRFAHLSPDAPTVDINWKGETSLLFSGQGFKDVTAFLEVPAKTNTLEVKLNGGSAVTLTVADFQFAELGFYTILLEGYDNPPTGNPNKLSARVVAN